MVHPHTNAGFVTGMLVGAAAGAALALLYTPRSGRKALELLKRRGGDAARAARQANETQPAGAGGPITQPIGGSGGRGHPAASDRPPSAR
jgi:hypothetical protein